MCIIDPKPLAGLPKLGTPNELLMPLFGVLPKLGVCVALPVDEPNGDAEPNAGGAALFVIDGPIALAPAPNAPSSGVTADGWPKLGVVNWPKASGAGSMFVVERNMNGEVAGSVGKDEVMAVGTEENEGVTGN